MDGKDLTRQYLLDNFSDNENTITNDNKKIINNSRRYIKKLKDSPTLRNFKNSIKNIYEQNGGRSWYDYFNDIYAEEKEKFKKKKNVALEVANKEFDRAKGDAKVAKGIVKKEFDRVKEGFEEKKKIARGIIAKEYNRAKEDAKAAKEIALKEYNIGKERVNEEYGKFNDHLSETSRNASESYNNFRNSFSDNLRNTSRNASESYKNFRNSFSDNLRNTYKNAKDSLNKYRKSPKSLNGSSIIDNLKNKALALVNKHANSLKEEVSNKLEKEIENAAVKLSGGFKSKIKKILGGKTNELYNYAKQNNKTDKLPNAIGKMILTYGKKIGEKSIVKFGGKLTSFIEQEIGGKINKFGNKLGGELNSLINKHIDYYNNKLNRISNMYADKYTSKYNNLMRQIDFRDRYLNKKSMIGGKKKEENNTEGGYSELRYSPNLSSEELISLVHDHADLKKKVGGIDNNLLKLLTKSKNKLNEIKGGSIDTIKSIFRDLLIQRRILMDELVNLELKYNSIENKNVLEDSNELYQLDKEFRNMADNLGISFDLDELTKKSFLNNRQLTLAFDTLGDLIKSLNCRLNNQNQLGGNNPFSYELFISESKIQLGGSNSHQAVQQQINEACDNYLKLIEIIKIHEDAILGLEVKKNTVLLEKIQIYINKLIEIIRNIHIFNSRFTNKIPQDEIDIIEYQISIYNKDFKSKEDELNELVKFNSTNQSGGSPGDINSQIVEYYTHLVNYYYYMITENTDLSKEEKLPYLKCLIKLCYYFKNEIRGEFMVLGPKLESLANKIMKMNIDDTKNTNLQSNESFLTGYTYDDLIEWINPIPYYIYTIDINKSISKLKSLNWVPQRTAHFSNVPYCRNLLPNSFDEQKERETERFQDQP